MESARSQGKVEVLMPCQTMDPARGSFMVHPMAVKKPNGTQKSILNPHYDPNNPYSEERLPVFRAAHQVTHTVRGTKAEPHPDAIDFVVYR